MALAAPVRLQLSRRKGFDFQQHSLATNGLPAVNVARPGDHGNPFVVGKHGSQTYCVELFYRLTVECLLPMVDVPTTHRAQWTLENRAELREARAKLSNVQMIDRRPDQS